MSAKTPTPAASLLTPDNHALVLIDHEGQMAFATNSIPMMQLRAHVAILAGGSKIFNVPTIVTTVAEETFSGPVFPEIEEVYPQASHNYIDRTTMNTWEDQNAYDAIQATGKKRIVLAGLWTSVCIAMPALSAIGEGFEVYVVTDACGDITAEAHNMAIQRMVQAGTIPITSVQYVLELQRDWARSETYDPVNELIKRSGGSYGLGVHYAKHMLHKEH
ncbi:hydrolase [Sphingobacterium lactis]|uniref:hydrolase n=1 Tax=Sphingobacterium lactis TaxID=797291 RepID=UPI003F7EDDE7